MGSDAKQEALERVAATVDVQQVFSVLPQAFLQVLNTLPEDEGAFEKYLAILKREPGLAAKALLVANTSFFAGRKSVDNLHAALVRLGTASTRNIILSVGMMHVLDGQRSLLRHTLACSALAARLAREADLDSGESYFTAGMLHDIGKLLLRESAQGRNQALDEPPTRGKEGISRESWLYGVDHAQFGALYARKWNLPDHLVEVIECHHEAGPSHGIMTQVISWSNAWTRQYYDMDISQRPDSDAFFGWMEKNLGLSRKRMHDTLGAMAEDLEDLTEHLGAPPVSMGDVVRMLTDANLALGEANLESVAYQRRTEEQLKQLKLIQEFSTVISACVGRKAICEKAVSLVVERLGIGTVSVMLPNAKSQLFVQAGVGLPSNIAGNPHLDEEGPVARQVYEGGQTLLVTNSRTERAVKGMTGRAHYKSNSFLSVPLKHGDAVLGVLNLANRPDGSPFEVDDKHLFETLANTLGALLFSEQERQRRESSDQRFRKLAANTPIALVGFDMQGFVWLWNRGAQHLTEIGAGDALGKRMPGALLYGGADKDMEHWIALCREGRGITHRRGIVETASGDRQHVSYSVFPIEGNTLAVWCAVNITNEVTSQVRAERRALEIESTRRALEQILDELDEDRILTACVENTVTAVSGGRGILLLKEEASQDAVLRAQTGFDDEPDWPKWLAGLSDLLGETLRDGKAVMSNQPLAATESGRNLIQEGGLRSIAAVPLRTGQKVMGALVVCDKNKGAFSAADLRVLYDMANVTALALHVAREHESRLRYEQTKTMTGMAVTYNHNINNALQAIQGAIDYAMATQAQGTGMLETMREIEEAARRIAEVNERMGQSLAPRFRSYPGGGQLIEMGRDD